MKLPQFTLRDLFWLIALAAMGCAWCLDHRHLSRELYSSSQAALFFKSHLRYMGYSAYWDSDDSLGIEEIPEDKDELIEYTRPHREMRRSEPDQP